MFITLLLASGLIKNLDTILPIPTTTLWRCIAVTSTLQTRKHYDLLKVILLIVEELDSDQAVWLPIPPP